MNDLNDLCYFAEIVKRGSLSAASTVLGVSKSVLSQHLAKLEAELGVRLIQRSTRRLRVTEIGQRFYERCRAVVTESERARQVIEEARGVPCGRARVSCTLNLSQIFVARAIATFMARYPDFEIALDIGNRDLDGLVDGYDLALRVAPQIKSSNWTVRSLKTRRHWLFASPELIASCGEPQGPDELARMPAIGGLFPSEQRVQHVWQLTGPGGQKRAVAYRPRLVTEDLFVLKEAALTGCGVADLPTAVCQDDVADGRLVRLLPKWQLPEIRVYAIYPSRNGVPAGVRMLVDHLMTDLESLLRSVRSFRLQVNAELERPSQGG